MAKRKEQPKQDLNADEVNKLLQRIDLDKPGAKEALDALRERWMMLQRLCWTSVAEQLRLLPCMPDFPGFRLTTV